MKRTLNLPLLIVLITLVYPSYAQNHSCATDEAYHEHEQNNPSLLSKRIEYEELLTRIAENPQNEKLSKKATHTIPVVFHIIHNYGEENISKAQILDGLRILNEDYSRTNADRTKTRAQFANVAANPEFEFKLATKDPQGNCTDGINRIASPLTVGGDLNSAIKQMINWDYRRYLNIWVIKELGRDSDNGYIIGFATFPWAADALNNGIVIRADYIGNIGIANRGYAGRSLTHEVGHWLGLFHPFQSGCGNSNCSRSGDRICDTPPVSAPSFGCPTSNNTCSNDSPDLPDQIENFMDYANGACANMFTEGQKTVMKATMSSYRTLIHSSGNLTYTGVGSPANCAPVSDFHTESRDTRICAGSSLTFENLSWKGEATDLVWTFEGGQPSTSTFESPEVTYMNPGIYKVELKASNANGSNTATKTAFIEVLDEVSDIASPFSDALDNTEQFENDYTITEENGIHGWRRINGLKYSGTHALEARINQNTPAGNRYSIILPAIDMRPMRGLEPKISFRVAYSLREDNNGELLLVYGSDDCGITWKSLGGLLGSSALATVSGQNPAWTPSSPSHWKVVSRDMDRHGFDTVSNLIIRLEVQSRSGNSIFLDDINISQFILSVDEPQQIENEINIYPNPSTGEFQIDLGRLSKNNTEIEIYDYTGKKVKSNITLNSSNNLLVRDLQPGIYNVKIKNNEAELIKRVIIAN